jgi:hypothetical protein
MTQPAPTGTQFGAIFGTADTGYLGHLAIFETRCKSKIIETYDP